MLSVSNHVSFHTEVYNQPIAHSTDKQPQHVGVFSVLNMCNLLVTNLFYVYHFHGRCTILIWCDFDRASSLICGNKMPTRCNWGFYCRSYCLLNVFRAPLCPSSGAQEYYTVVAACGISCCSIPQTGHITLSSTLDKLLEKPQHKIPHAATTV